MSRVSKVETVFDLYVKGAKVWVTDETQGWVSATIEETSVDDHGHLNLDLVTTTGLRLQSSASLKTLAENKGADLPPLKNPPILEGIDDLTSLSYLHEPAVLHNIKTRYSQHNIYTYSGIVLIAVNPFQKVNLYSDDVIRAYCNRRRGELEPHLFAVAEDAFRSMVREKKDQSIIVSGESGAGKTVSAKFIMRYFAAANDTGSHASLAEGSARHSASDISEVEEQVLATNPIMESFGNAKTTRNDNSSRFGKYIEILFDEYSNIVGARIRTYLLERSRCVDQPETERNYHVFYQLCAGAPAAEKKELGLTSFSHFHYLNQGGGDGTIPGVDDAAEFETTQRALSTIGISVNTQWRIFRLLAGLLHLGNMEIGKAGNNAHIPDDHHSLTMACKLLEVDVSDFRKWLTKKRLVTRSESVETNLSHANSCMMRDSVTKYIYAALFEWIVKKVNEALCDDSVRDKSSRFIGVLDIYGFEHFKKNSFEQFCINYANEKLQQEFNQHVFKLEQEEYVREQINWSFIDFNDNQPCINLIEGKLGILALLDEESRLPSGSDKSFIDKLYKQFLIQDKKAPKSSNPRHSIAVQPPKQHTSGTTANDTTTKRIQPSDYFSKPRFSQEAFIVHHFAHDVCYETESFLDKNRDTVSDEMLQVFKASKSAFFTMVLASHKTEETSPKPDAMDKRAKMMSVGSKAHVPNNTSKIPPVRGRGVSKSTLGSVFKLSLAQLMDTIHSTNVSYIRCIKPNSVKKPFMFDSMMVLGQLRACGVLETIRISTAGYPGRWTYDEFAERYFLLLRSEKWTSDVRALSETILQDAIKDADKYQLGLTKIFFRAGQLAYLEKLRTTKLDRSVTLIQKNVRRMIYSKHYKNLRRHTINVQARWRGKIQRRAYQELRRNRAATYIEANWRGYVARKRFGDVQKAAVTLQRGWRCYVARTALQNLRQQHAASCIQALWRGHLGRARVARTKCLIILIQSNIRRRQAKKVLKLLKVEARSINHYKEIKYKLENKVVEITQTLAKREAEIKQLQAHLEHSESQVKFWKERSERMGQKVKEEVETRKEETLSKKDFERLESNRQGMESQLNAANNVIKVKESELAEAKAEIMRMKAQMDRMREDLRAPRGMSADDATKMNAMNQELNKLRRLLAQEKAAKVHAEARNRHPYEPANGASLSLSPSLSFRAEHAFLHPGRAELVNPLSHLDQYPPEARSNDSNKYRRHSSVESWSKASKELAMPRPGPIRPRRVPSHSVPGKLDRSDEEALMEEEHTRGMLQDSGLHVEVIQNVIKTYEIPDGANNKASRKDIVFPSQILGILLIQFWRHSMAHQMQQVMGQAIRAIEEKCSRCDSDAVVCFWLANIFEIQSIIKSTKDERERSGLAMGTSAASKRASYLGQGGRAAGAMDTDRVATKIKNDLDNLTLDIYGNWLRVLRRRLSKYIIPAIIENQALPGFISKDQSSAGFFKKLVAPVEFTVEDLLEVYTSIMRVMNFYYVEDMIIRQTLSELLKTSSYTSFNHVIMRKNFCTWKRGMQIQYNVSRIIEWCANNDLQEGTQHMERMMQAAKLMQLNKATPADLDLYVEDLFDVCDLLTPTQIKKLMSIYAVGDYENPISPEILKAVADRSAASEKNDNFILEQTSENDLSWFDRPEPRRIGVIDKYLPPAIENKVPRIVLLLKFA